MMTTTVMIMIMVMTTTTMMTVMKEDDNDDDGDDDDDDDDRWCERVCPLCPQVKSPEEEEVFDPIDPRRTRSSLAQSTKKITSE